MKTKPRATVCRSSGVYVELNAELAGTGRFVDANNLHRYGKQQPKKYNYKGQPAVGPETKEISPYSIVGLSATRDVTKNVSLTGGVDNLFDKRLWRAGNAQTTGDLAGANYIAGAGAYTYNEPGRTWYMSINTHF